MQILSFLFCGKIYSDRKQAANGEKVGQGFVFHFPISGNILLLSVTRLFVLFKLSGRNAGD